MLVGTALAERFGVGTVRVDSGGTLSGVLVRAGRADELHLLVHPMLVGRGAETVFFRDPADPAAAQPIPLRFLAAEPLADGLVLLSYAFAR